MIERQKVLLGAEIALAALTVVVTISLERLFTDLGFLRELVILALGSHLVAALCRRADLSMALSTPISGLALIVLGTAVFYPDAAALIVPTGETVSVLGDDLREAWRIFGEDAAPVIPHRGFLVTTAVLLWYGVFLADWAAFRLRSPLEAVAPATAVFVFASLLGVDRNSIAHGLLYAVGLLGVLLTMRAERQVREEVWVAGGARDGITTTLRVGAVAGACAVLVGALVAPRLPGASAEPIVDIAEIGNPSQVRSVVSPLVEISTSLVEQTNTELFSVRVDPDEADYWRLMALTTFEKEIWRRSSNFDDARGPVGSDIDARVATTTVRQEITIAGLGNIYLPAAYEVSNIIDDDGVDLEYEVATGALVVERGLEEIPAGMTYTIESQVPDYDPADLPTDAAQGLDDEFVRHHTQLPDDCAIDEAPAETNCWPTEVTDLAQRIIADAGATTDHQRVIALQNFFLDPDRFTYDIDVALEHDIGDMTTFLDVGRGYCEQFASTFAAMARSLGIPARVAVGFTWGDWDEARGEFVVSGRHAHAWPEVYFADVGWIIFDPTPGRSRGHDGDITQLPTPQQFPANEQGDEILPPPTDLPPEPSVAPGPGDPTPQNPSPNSQDDIPAEDEEVVVGAPTDDGGGPWSQVLIGLVVVAAVLAFVPAAQALRRRRRLAAVAADPVGRGEMAWDDAVVALRLIGLEPRPHQTPHEFASTVARSTRDVGPLRDLADQVTTLRYADGDDAVPHALAAQDAAAVIVQRCRTIVGTPRVVREALDPRSLLGPPPPSALAR
ncbi:MAG: DUF3488 and transglutaminase-like domain-containing protein [Acidimicrobiales bacterium]|nr:DUF3488 and transglutaminase-like domain-containing protein [Acidimicrobiales bacterium]